VGSGTSGISSMFCSKNVNDQNCADQIASVSVFAVSNMHMGLFCEDVDTLEMYEHLLGHQNPRDSS
jgi:hypothetical protein